MSRFNRMSRTILVALIVVACGSSDPLAGVENCSDLAEAVADHLPTIEDDGDALRAFDEQVEALGTQMGQDAIARGAELEATICAQAITAAASASITETFEEVQSGLDD